MEPAEVSSTLHFLEEQSHKHSAFFSATPRRILALVATTSQPRCHAKILVRRLAGLSGSDHQIDLTVEGGLPTNLAPGDRVSASLVNLRTYDGYQLKTREVSPAARYDQLVTTEGGRSTIHSSFVYTIHHSPNTKEFFQRIPTADIERHARNVRYALIGVGPNVNVSPRFVWFYRSELGKVHLYWGDGHLNKTAANLGKNLSVTVAILDLNTFRGRSFRGIGKRFSSAEDPETWKSIEVGFSSGNWGTPSVTIDASLVDGESIEPA